MQISAGLATGLFFASIWFFVLGAVLLASLGAVGMTTSLICLLVAVLAPLLIYARIAGEPPTQVMGLSRPRMSALFSAILIGASTWLITLAIAAWFANLVPAVAESAKRLEVAFVSDALPPLAKVLVLSVLPAIAEELLFRGLLLRALVRILPAWLAAVVSALVFAAYHLNLAQMPATFFLGLILAALTLWCRSLWPAIIAHFLNNAIVLIVAVYGGGLHPRTWTALLVVPILALALFLAGSQRFGRPRDNRPHANVS